MGKWRDLRYRTACRPVNALANRHRITLDHKGLFLAWVHDGELELLTPRGFKPATFGPAPKQNGKGKAKQKRSSLN
jgi:hypothetical protein